jgi:hypothetical protein
VVSGEVLLGTGQERLGEEEAGNPEVWRSILVDPVLHELKSLEELKDP